MTPEQSQKLASNPGQSAFVTASAGSGKTKTLIDRVARLLLQEADPARILCITYTRNAAAEMQNRLFERLGGWSILPDATLAAELHKLTGEPTLPGDRETLLRARSLFASALETPGGLKILTVHAFCEKVLRRFPMEAGLSPSFTVLDDATSAEIAREAATACARQAMQRAGQLADAYDCLAAVFPHKEFEALLARFEAGRIDLERQIAAAGSLEILTALVWAELGFAGGRISFETVQSEIIGQLDIDVFRQAAKLLIEGSSTDVRIATAILAAINLTPINPESLASVVLTDGDRPNGNLMKAAVLKRNAPFRALFETEILSLLDKLDRIKSWNTAHVTEHALVLASAYSREYGQAKTQRGGLDFADLVEATRKLVEERPSAEWVLYKLDGGIEHILLDEAQDTAPPQWDILARLADPFFDGAGAVRNTNNLARTLFIVGDQKQSIYSFQGAEPERLGAEIRAFTQKIADREGQSSVLALDTSFRSTPQVLQLVDATFADPDRALALTGNLGDRVAHRAFRSSHAGCVDLWDLDIEDKKVAGPAWSLPAPGEPPVADAFDRLGERVASEIRRIVADGDLVMGKSGQWQPARFGDILILTRKRSHVFDAVLRALKRAGVPVAGADRIKLAEHIAHADLLSLIRFALFPQDDLNLASLLKSPFVGLDDARIYPLAHNRGTTSLWARIVAAAGSDEALKQALHGLEAIQRRRHLLPLEFCQLALADRDAAGRTARARFAGRLGSEGIEVIDALLSLIEDAEARGVRTLEQTAEFLGGLGLELKREMDQATDEVRIMTVHGAKGLEAPIVFVPDTVSQAARNHPGFVNTARGVPLLQFGAQSVQPQLIATLLQGKSSKADDEGQRLLYVALTRARDRLVIAGRVHRSKLGTLATAWYGDVECAFVGAMLAPGIRELDIDGHRVRRFGPDPTPAGAAATARAPALVVPDWMTRSPGSDRHTPSLLSPSRLLGQIRGQGISPLERSGATSRLRRGDIIHKLLELLPETVPADRLDQGQRFLDKEGDLTPEARSEILDACLGLLDLPQAALLFGPQSRAEVAVAGTSALLGNRPLSGRIDRLVITPERVIIADFKTGRRPPRRAEDADPSAILQLAAYRDLLGQLYPDREIETCLVWTSGPSLMTIPENLLAKAAAEFIRTVESARQPA